MASTPSIEQRLAARDPGRRRALMMQSWRRLLFLHWTVDAGLLQQRLPPGLEVDRFDGDAYVAIVPFFMCGVRPRLLPPLPGVSSFLELNVRTYVHDAAGVPGVWFFSLDANCAPAVWVARTFFKLPYLHARMRAEIGDGGWTDYRSTRRGTGTEAHFVYRGVGDGRLADPGSLEFFLLERYYLYAFDAKRERLLRGQVAHSPYQFSNAEVEAFDRAPLLLDGIDLGSADYCHACAAANVDVRILGIERLAGS